MKTWMLSLLLPLFSVAVNAQKPLYEIPKELSEAKAGTLHYAYPGEGDYLWDLYAEKSYLVYIREKKNPNPKEKEADPFDYMFSKLLLKLS